MLKRLKAPASISTIALDICQQLFNLVVELNDGELPALLFALTRSTSMKELILFGHWKPTDMLENAECLKNLTHISLCQNGWLEGKSLLAIGQNCKNLKSFTLRYRRFSRYGHNDVSVGHFLEAIKDTIEELEIGPGIMRSEDFAVLEKCKKLRHFVNVDITPLALHSISQLSGLVYLSIECRHLPLSIAARAGDYIEAFARKNLQKIRHLDLFPKAVDDQVLETVAENCPQLTSLGLRCDNVTDRGMAIFFQKCTKLESLMLSSFHVSMSNITSKSFTAMSSSLRLLTCSNSITKEELAKIRKQMPELKINS